MKASRYSRMTVRVDGDAATSPAVIPEAGTVWGRRLIATRTIAKKQMSARSSSGVTVQQRNPR